MMLGEGRAKEKEEGCSDGVRSSRDSKWKVGLTLRWEVGFSVSPGPHRAESCRQEDEARQPSAGGRMQGVCSSAQCPSPLLTRSPQQCTSACSRGDGNCVGGLGQSGRYHTQQTCSVKKSRALTGMARRRKKQQLWSWTRKRDFKGTATMA